MFALCRAGTFLQHSLHKTWCHYCSMCQAHITLQNSKIVNTLYLSVSLAEYVGIRLLYFLLWLPTGKNVLLAVLILMCSKVTILQWNSFFSTSPKSFRNDYHSTQSYHKLIFHHLFADLFRKDISSFLRRTAYASLRLWFYKTKVTPQLVSSAAVYNSSKGVLRPFLYHSTPLLLLSLQALHVL